MELRLILKETVYDVAKGDENKEREILATGLVATDKEIERGVL